MDLAEAAQAAPHGGRGILIEAAQVLIAKVNARGNWVFVELTASSGLTGLGEASHGSGFTAASDEHDEAMRQEVEALVPLIVGQSPFRAEAFREAAWADAKRAGLRRVTAFSALEQAMWDLAGKAAGLPVCDLLGGSLRERVPLYANINRATDDRSPEGFARNAEKAVAEGFRAVKLAPFDDFPKLTAPETELERFAKLGIARVEATRRAIGGSIRLMVDCHSKFDRSWALDVGRRLEPLGLFWYEEPLPLEDTEDCSAAGEALMTRLAGGEILFGREGFEPLLGVRSFDVVMPDIKHCGGLWEAKKIAAAAETAGVAISPHNPSGPVSLAASAQLAATVPNLEMLEHAWGEVSWRWSLVRPGERIESGDYVVSERPGIGVELDFDVLSQHS